MCEKTTIEREHLLLGNNNFETSKILVPASSELPIGTVVFRDGDKFSKITTPATQVPAGVLASTITNGDASDITVSCRIVISGDVNKNMLKANDLPIGADFSDKLRNVSIIPIDTYKCN
ncbi:MAG: hypothetical protein ACRC4W_08170 [Treponemataceae bacterium]